MTPIELQRKWNLSNTQIAIALGKAEETIRSYNSPPNATRHRNAPETVIRLCDQLDKDWTRQERVDIQLILA